MQKTTIEWTRGDDGTPGNTANPIRARRKTTGKIGHHCVMISPGCTHCYSAKWNGWRGNGLPFTKAGGEQAQMFLDEKVLSGLLRHRKPCRVFLCDMTDIFGDWVPDAWLDRIFAVANVTPHITYQILTKRADRMAAYIESRSTRRWSGGSHPIFEAGRGDGGVLRGRGADVMNAGAVLMWPLPNCWLGVSVEDQKRADERIPHLIRTPASVRFLSCEPLLGPVNLRQYWYSTHNWHDWLTGNTGIGRTTDNLCSHDQTGQKIDWVIGGFESGPKARPGHPDWARSLRDQCQASGVPFFWKQNGEWFPSSQYDYDTELPRLSGRPEIYVGPQGEVMRTSSPFEHGCPCDVPPGYVSMVRVGKKAAGRVLDGRTWDQFPQPLTPTPA